MEINIHLFGLSVLMLVFATLLILSKKPSSVRKPSKDERRAHPRYKTSLRIKYKTPLEEGVSWIKDISESGARLFLNNTLKTLEIGESLGVEIDLPYEAQPVFIEGNIVWSQENDAGFRFDKVIQGDINKVIQYATKGE